LDRENLAVKLDAANLTPKAEFLRKRTEKRAPYELFVIRGPHMAARKWTTEQKARQAALIRTWAPWAQSTGPKTPKGKAVSSKNAVNYSCRELLRDMARTNRALVGFINGMTPAPTFDRTAIDGLLDDVERALDATAATRKAKAAATATASSKALV
jgi:hypothetical protein